MRSMAQPYDRLAIGKSLLTEEQAKRAGRAGRARAGLTLGQGEGLDPGARAHALRCAALRPPGHRQEPAGRGAGNALGAPAAPALA